MKKLSDIVKLGKKDKKTGKKDKKTGHDWPEFRALSDEKLQKKLEGFPEDKMLELYKKLERECNYRIDPENYKRHWIIKNFMSLWHAKIRDEKAKAARGEKTIPATGEEINQIFGDGSRGISTPGLKVSDNGKFPDGKLPW